jgi:hypothetical protein
MTEFRKVTSENCDELPISPEVYGLPEMLVPNDLKGLVTSKEDFQKRMFKQKVPLWKAHKEWEWYAFGNGCIVKVEGTVSPQQAKAFLKCLDDAQIRRVKTNVEKTGTQFANNYLENFQSLIKGEEVDDVKLMIAASYFAGVLSVDL